MEALRLEALGLIIVAVILAVVVPPILARARWPARSPRAALVGWQAIGLGGGCAILGAGLTLAAADLSRHWLTGLARLPHGWSRLGPLGWIGVALTTIAGGWLIAVLIASTRRVTRSRHAHRDRLDLVADELVVREHGGHGAELALVRLLDHDATAAYCLPGLHPQIVLSRGTVDTLPTDELAAVVTHEQAHARGQHDLVIHPFRAWRETFRFLPAATQALGAVELLVEMLADDAARARCGDDAVRRALRRLVSGNPAGHDLTSRDLTSRDLAARIARMPVRPLTPAVTAAICVAAVTLVVAPPVCLMLT
jgi:hypothetical protein